jgi:hypothetical protein
LSTLISTSTLRDSPLLGSVLVVSAHSFLILRTLETSDPSQPSLPSLIQLSATGERMPTLSSLAQ